MLCMFASMLINFVNSFKLEKYFGLDILFILVSISMLSKGLSGPLVGD